MKCARASGSPAISSGTRCAGDNPISLRSARHAPMRSRSCAISRSAVGSMFSKLALGKGCSAIVSPGLPASGATVCHSSSVMKGMNGCARRSVASSSRTSTERVPRAAATSPAAAACCSCTFGGIRRTSRNIRPTRIHRARGPRGRSDRGRGSRQWRASLAAIGPAASGRRTTAPGTRAGRGRSPAPPRSSARTASRSTACCRSCGSRRSARDRS